MSRSVDITMRGWTAKRSGHGITISGTIGSGAAAGMHATYTNVMQISSVDGQVIAVRHQGGPEPRRIVLL